MKYFRYLNSSKRFWPTFRLFSDDPSKTFKDKGMAEENRYFLRRQEEELRRLRKQLGQLAKNQEKLHTHIELTKRAIEKLRDDQQKVDDEK